MGLGFLPGNRLTDLADNVRRVPKPRQRFRFQKLGYHEFRQHTTIPPNAAKVFRGFLATERWPILNGIWIGPLTSFHLLRDAQLCRMK